MFDSAQLATLASVVRTGTFDAAAAELHLTPSAVSQRIKALEQHTGTVLVRRSRPCRATDAGQILVRLAGQLDLLGRDARAALNIGGDDPFAMTIVVNADSVSTWFLPALARCAEGSARFAVHIEDEAYTARLLRDGTAMAAVTSDAAEVQGCRSRPLGSLTYRAVATPAFAAEHLPSGTDPAAGAELAAAPRMRFNRQDELQERFLAAIGADAQPALAHEVPSSSGFLECVRLGVAWGAIPSAQAQPYLRSGELIDLLAPRALGVPLYWQHWRVESASLEALTAAVTEQAECELQQG